MEFQSIRSSTVSQMFEDQILEMIISGELTPGTRLPSESELAKATGISKSAVNIGIKSLEKKGFLKVTPRQKVEVADYYRTGNLETLVTILKVQGEDLDKSLAESILTFREAIEAKAMQILAHDHTEADIAVLEKTTDDILKKMVENKGTIHDYAEMIFQYHLTIAVLGGDLVLPMMFNAFHDIAIPMWEDWISICGMDRAVNLLKLFTRLIDEGDSEGALEAYKSKVELFKDDLEKGVCIK